MNLPQNAWLLRGRGPHLPFAVVFTPGTPVLPTGISARRRYLKTYLFTYVRRLRVHCKEWAKNNIKTNLVQNLLKNGWIKNHLVHYLAQIYLKEQNPAANWFCFAIILQLTEFFQWCYVIHFKVKIAEYSLAFNE